MLIKRNDILDEIFNEYFIDGDLKIGCNLDVINNNGKSAISCRYNKSFVPPNDISETESEFTIKLMLPGFNKKDFKLNIEKNTLTIEGERQFNEKINYKVRESYFGSFKRVYTLPTEIKINKVDAEYIDGVLNILIPKDVKKLNSRIVEVK